VVLGDLVSLGGLHRLDLPALTQAAVVALAGQHSVDAADVYRVTGGNPFFVTEVLATPEARVPASVRDAVLARAARLSPAARAVIDVAALIGVRVDMALLDRVDAPEPGVLEECVAMGVLEQCGRDIAFRHELARTVLDDAVSPSRRLALQRHILGAMTAAPPGTYDPARLAHHAEGAGDAAAVLEHATAAAHRAASVDAHREAAAQYGRVLRFASGLPPDALGPLLRGRSYECSVIGDTANAVAAAQRAVDCWREVGDSRAEGDASRWLSRTLWLVGSPDEADAAGRSAVDLLERLPPGAELAMAYSNLSQLRMLAWKHDEAEAWGRRAIELAQRVGDTETLVHALNNVGSALLLREQEEGRELLEESVRAARDAALHEHVARGLSNLMEIAVTHRQLARADRYGDEALLHAEERDLGEHAQYLHAWRAHARLMQGRWAEALDEAFPLMTRPATPAYIRAMANTAVGRVWARRGDPGVAGVLDVALALAGPYAELQWSVPVRTARAEAAWLAGNLERAEAELQTVFESAERCADSWSLGELAFWTWKASGTLPPREGLAEPFALQMAGDWRAAAARWDALGCPYEAALARADADDETALRQSLEAFAGLGAVPAVRIVARRLRTLGAHTVPRGPRASTRENAARLTRRELEVLLLLADGLRNADIADRLFVSTKTIDHHVSAVLAKLGARNRGEATHEARRLGLLAEGPER
jgi:DNA-binding CsgD family transcriptional regulator